MCQRASDDDLVQAAREGDEIAFAQLMQRHRGWVCRLMHAFVRNHEQAEDLAQEAFCRLYQHLGDYTTRGKFVPWLKRIAVNQAKNFLRDHRREIFVSGDALPVAAAADTGCDPAAVLSSRLLQEEVRAALGQLSDEQRQVLVLHYFGGRSVEAIAQTLHCPVGTVKSRLFHGRRQVRQALMAKWDPHD